MSDPLNPQAREMADESMVRTLAAQAEAIWPQEAPLFRRYDLPATARILDAGCGTGEITRRLADAFPGATLLGVDIIDEHLELARRASARLGDRVVFENRSVFELGLPDASFDLAVCRHVVQAIPHAERVLAELKRVTRPGGWLHVIAEDYGMIHFEPRTLNADEFWGRGPVEFGRALGTDLHVGRNAFRLFRQLGLEDVRVDFAVVDTLRAPRETFAKIWESWRDGYADSVAEHTTVTKEEFLAHFEDMLATIRDADGYGVWFVPILGGRVPG